MSTIEIGVVSAAVLEMVKWIIRKFSPGFEFPASFYVVAIPVLNILLVPLLALIGFEGFVMPTDWQAWIMLIVRTLIGSLVSLGTYAVSLRPFKAAFRGK